MKKAALLTMLVAGLVVLDASKAGAALPPCPSCEVGGSCIAGDLVGWSDNYCHGDHWACNDCDLCTVDVCDSAVWEGSGTPPPNAALTFSCYYYERNCDDGNVCTVDSCHSETGCHHTPVDCNDGNQCTDDFCDPISGCENLPLHGGSCDDGNACTGLDECSDGICSGQPLDLSSCNDHNACTFGDTCYGGTCLGWPGDCDDYNPCTDDACDPAVGCVYTNNTNPCNDHNACTTNDTCSAGTCGGGPLDCNDGNECTDDLCHPATGCEFTNNANPCSDHNACTTNDTCSAGTCGGGPLDCNDGNECTDDACDPALGCLYTDRTGPCEDGDMCGTSGDTCVSGVCVGGPPVDCDDDNPCTHDTCSPFQGFCNNDPMWGTPCDDGNACTTDDFCGRDGGCEGDTPVNCDDGNACTDDACDPALGCLYTDRTGPCEDGDLCGSSGDTCVSGVCVLGPPVDCDDDNPCTHDTCSPFQGFCNNDPMWGTPCDDGNACTTEDFCGGDGVCEGDTPVNCDDGNACTDDACDPATGCEHTPVDCDDGNVCTDDSCEPDWGCRYHVNVNPCDDGNACTTDDVCSIGNCSGLPLDCDDDNVCTADACDPAVGCDHSPTPGAPCGLACEDTGDSLGGGICSLTSFECTDAGACEPGSIEDFADTCSGDVDQPSVTYWSCSAVDGDGGETCVSATTSESDSCSDSGSTLGGGTCSSTDWTCTDGQLTKTASSGSDTCGGDVDNPDVTYWSCGISDEAEGGTVADTCVAATISKSDSCSDSGSELGGGRCSARNWTCTDGQLTKTPSSGSDYCGGGDDDPNVTYWSCGISDETEGGTVADTCVSATTERFDECDDTGSELFFPGTTSGDLNVGEGGGGTCEAADWRCDAAIDGAGDQLVVDTSGGTDSCNDVTDPDRPLLSYFICSATDGSVDDSCAVEQATYLDVCLDDGGAYGGGTCEVWDWSCHAPDGTGDDTAVMAVQESNVDTCSGTPDQPSVTSWSCQDIHTCVSATREGVDNCSDSGDELGGGTCSARDWACTDGQLTKTGSSGSDYCGGTADDPNVTFWSCHAEDGTGDDTCTSETTSESDSCTDSGTELGGGTCSATDWTCADGQLTSTATSGADYCGGDADDPNVTFWSCHASDGTGDDTCTSETTERSDSCTDDGTELGGGTCDATDWACAGGQLASTATSGTDACDPLASAGTTTFFTCDAADGVTYDRCVPGTTDCSDVLDGVCSDGVCDDALTLCEEVNRDYGDPCRGGNEDDTACTEPDICDGEGVCLFRNEPCALVTSSALCAFDVLPDKGRCTASGEPCVVDAACQAAGGDLCADTVCQNGDGDPIADEPPCTDPCSALDDFCQQIAQFRLLFTPDVQSFPGYRLPASNPGQTFYNLIVEGNAGSTVPVSISVPYPFVTQGGQPVHVYDGDAVVGACVDASGSPTGARCWTTADCEPGQTCNSNCFVPGEAEQQFAAQWSMDDWVAGVPSAGHAGGGDGWTLLCDPVCGPAETDPDASDGRCTLDLAVTLPTSGKAYVNIHLDYGLKGPGVDANPCDDGLVDRYDQGGSSGTEFVQVGFDALVNTDTEDGPVAIYDGTAYAFSHVDPSSAETYDDTVSNLNVFKPIAGSFGRCTHENNGNPCRESVEVELIRNDSGEVVQSGATDADGFWTTPYKHKGKPALYTVVIYEPGCTVMGQEIELQGNGWANVDFDASTCTATAEYGKGRNAKKSR